MESSGRRRNDQGVSEKQRQRNPDSRSAGSLRFSLPGGPAGKTAWTGTEKLSNGDPPSLILWGVEESEDENKRRELGLLTGGEQAWRPQIEL